MKDSYLVSSTGFGPGSFPSLPPISAATMMSRLSRFFLPPPLLPMRSMMRASTGASSQSGWMRASGLVWCQGGEAGRSVAKLAMAVDARGGRRGMMVSKVEEASECLWEGA